MQYGNKEGQQNFGFCRQRDLIKDLGTLNLSELNILSV